MNFFYAPFGVDEQAADAVAGMMGDQGNDGRALDYPGDLPANPPPLTEREERMERKYSVMDAANERQEGFREEKRQEEKANRVHNFLEDDKKRMPPPDSVDVITVEVVDPINRKNLGKFMFKRPWTTERLLKEIKKVKDGKINAKLGTLDIIGSLTPGQVTHSTISRELSEMKELKGKTINAMVRRGGKRRKTKRTRRRKRRRKTRRKSRRKKRRNKRGGVLSCFQTSRVEWDELQNRVNENFHVKFPETSFYHPECTGDFRLDSHSDSELVFKNINGADFTFGSQFEVHKGPFNSRDVVVCESNSGITEEKQAAGGRKKRRKTRKKKRSKKRRGKKRKTRKRRKKRR